MFAALAEQAEAWFAAEGVAIEARRIGRIALMRYHGQGGEIAVPWDAAPGAAATAFIAAHQTLYGFVLEAAVELVTLRLEAVGLMPRPAPTELPPGRGAVPTSRRAVHAVGGTTQAPVYDRATLGAGDSFAGPAIVTQLDATTVLPAGWSAIVHPSGALLLATVAERLP